jgi:hypothetical protein
MTSTGETDGAEDLGNLPPPPLVSSRATARTWRSAWLGHTPTSTLILPAPAQAPVRREQGSAPPAVPASAAARSPQGTQPAPAPRNRRRAAEVAVVLAVAAALLTAVVVLPVLWTSDG